MVPPVSMLCVEYDKIFSENSEFDSLQSVLLLICLFADFGIGMKLLCCCFLCLCCEEYIIISKSSVMEPTIYGYGLLPILYIPPGIYSHTI